MEGIRPCTQDCILCLYGGTSECRSDGGSLPELRILPVCQRYALIVPVVEGEVIVLDWPEKSTSWLVSPCEIRRCKRSCRRSVGSDQ